MTKANGENCMTTPSCPLSSATAMKNASPTGIEIATACVTVPLITPRRIMA